MRASLLSLFSAFLVAIVPVGVSASYPGGLFGFQCGPTDSGAVQLQHSCEGGKLFGTRVWTGDAAVDNTMNLYGGGILIGNSAYGGISYGYPNWVLNGISVSLSSSDVIAFYGENKGGPAGATICLSSTDNNGNIVELTHDTTNWRCTLTPPPPNWMTNAFVEDSTWISPINGDTYTASSIWANPNNDGNQPIWCRRSPICSKPGSAVGDPQFTGFAGQSYQVHGMSNTIYNIISSNTIQYNALFTYLEEGKCRRGTPCFSHPGNYFGAVGISIKDEISSTTTHLSIQAGPVDVGFSSMMLNNATFVGAVQVGSYKIELISPFELELVSDEFSFRIQNSDHFLNQDVSIGTKLSKSIGAYKIAVKASSSIANAAALRSELPHGILGQSWSTKTYPNRWKHLEGNLFDYIVQDGIHGNEFKYNRF